MSTQARIEPTRGSGISTRRTNGSSATHQANRTPKPLNIAPDAPMLEIAMRVHARIKDNRSQTACGSFVFATADRRVYVMRESSIASIRMADDQFTDLVGLYAANPRNGEKASAPKLRQIMEDLAEHFRLAGLSEVPA